MPRETCPRPRLQRARRRPCTRRPRALSFALPSRSGGWPYRKARYYNVQLHRNGVKILSAWPRGARLRVVGSWRYLGRRQSLLPGTYSWYVWPGLGAPELRRYGKLLGTSRFRVKRQAPSR